jgi:aryl-alcohol dehydrogenase-like predicted oxidoreductase
MNHRVLGKTNLNVSELGLGGLFVSSYGGDVEEGKRAVRHALELGINYLDTAPGYGNSEEVLGQALAACPKSLTEKLIITTKLGGRPKPFDPKDKAGLLGSVEESLRLLHRDYIDCLLIHEPDRPGQYDWWTNIDTADGPVMEVLAELKASGKIKSIGLGGTTTSHMAALIRTGKFDAVLTAFNYSLLFREATLDLLPAAAEQHMGVIVGSPLQQGTFAARQDAVLDQKPAPRWLATPRREQLRVFFKFVDQTGIALPELAMRFVISNKQISTVLTGSRSVAEVQANADAIAKGPLPADMLKRLDEIAAMVPFRPYEEPFGLPLGRGWGGPGVAR